MITVPISDDLLRRLHADYRWYQADPVGMQSGRLELLCTRIEQVLEEYKRQAKIPLKDPYPDYK